MQTNRSLNFIVGSKIDNTFDIEGFEAGGFSYVYKKPNVTTTIDDDAVTAKIDGNKLTIEGDVFERED